MAYSPSSANAAVSLPASGVVDRGLKFSFACPKCGDGCVVEWKHLNKTLRCRKCGVGIQIDRTKISALREATTRLDFKCPRCRYLGKVTSNAAADGIQCAACDLPLFLGPDGRLHTGDEVARLQQLASLPRSISSLEAWIAVIASFFMRSAFRIGWPLRIAFGLVVAVGVFFGLLRLGSIVSEPAPASSAYHFTQQCLSREWNDPSTYVEDDPLQNQAFESWRLRNFASINARIRPTTDSVTVTVETLQKTEQSGIVKVAMSSDFVGKRTLTMHWYEKEGSWYLDAQKTLKE